MVIHSPIAHLTPMPTRLHRHTCLSSFNVPTHAVLHQGVGWGLDTRAPGRAGTWLGTEAPPCRSTDSVPGLSFALRSDSAYELPRAGLHLLPRCALDLTLLGPTGKTLGPVQMGHTRSHTHTTATTPLQARARYPVAHRPWDVVEDLVSSGVPVRTSLGAKQASQLPCAILSGDKGGGRLQPGP